ncbi:MAG: hypothetical protein M1834_002673 [Cirrosporium novae-zelandiae]|nr:MAG: hypothetical protein M1834_002673 [Cirrosporium novae-zelandiae]
MTFSSPSVNPSRISPPFTEDVSPLPPDQDLSMVFDDFPTVLLDEDKSVLRPFIPENRREMMEYLSTSLNLSRLNAIHDSLWLAGRPIAARPLHHQRLLNRQLLPTQQFDLHLVWSDSRLFVKPLPDFLLSHHFWLEILGKDAELHKSAAGLLFSYFWLVRNEDDLRLAKDAHLMNSSIKFEEWKKFVHSTLPRLDPRSMSCLNKRFQYGELRANRLNTIYHLSPHTIPLTSFIRGYFYDYGRYKTFFSRNFAWTLTIFIYLQVILSAMQVGLGTDRLQKDGRVQDASVVFSVFSMILPAMVVGIALGVSLFLVVYNVTATIRFGNKVTGMRNSTSGSETEQIVAA